MVEQLREQVGNLLAAAQLLTPAIREQKEQKYDQYLAILNQGLYRLLRLTEHSDLYLRGGAPRRKKRKGAGPAGLRKITPLFIVLSPYACRGGYACRVWKAEASVRFMVPML